MALRASQPIPGMPKMVSTMTEPAMRKGTCIPRMVRMGMTLLRRACLKMTFFSGRPLARAVRMKSWRMVSSIPLRM